MRNGQEKFNISSRHPLCCYAGAFDQISWSSLKDARKCRLSSFFFFVDTLRPLLHVGLKVEVPTLKKHSWGNLWLQGPLSNCFGAFKHITWSSSADKEQLRSCIDLWLKKNVIWTSAVHTTWVELVNIDICYIGQYSYAQPHYIHHLTYFAMIPKNVVIKHLRQIYEHIMLAGYFIILYTVNVHNDISLKLHVHLFVHYILCKRQRQHANIFVIRQYRLITLADP